MENESAPISSDPDSSGPVIHGEDGSVQPLPVGPASIPSEGSQQNSRIKSKGKGHSKGIDRNPVSGTLKSGSGLESKDQKGSPSGEKTVDQKLVAETQQQIKSLVNEIVKLSKEDISREEFFGGFLTRCVTALSSNGGALWLKKDSVLSLDHQVNLAKTGLPSSGDQAAMHDRLLKKLVERGEPTIEPPNSIQAGAESGNPTNSLLVIAPIKSDGQTIGLVEIFQRTGGGPVTQRGYLRFLMQMADIAGEFEKNHQIRILDQRQELWTRLEQFLTCIHKTLDPVETAYRISSDGRRFIDCDRLTVASIDGGRPRVVSSSGLDMVQRRADQIKAMEDLVSVVCKAKKPLFYTGDSSSLAPQIENSLHDYLDLSHSKSVAVIPVAYRPTDIDWDEVDHQHQAKTGKKKKPKKKKLLGAFVVENLAQDDFTETQLQRIELVKHHGTLALGNADQHNGIFLMPVWKAVGGFAKYFHLANLPKTLSAVFLVLMAIIAMVIVPYEFAMPADGVIQPQNRFEVYAGVGGVVKKIPVSDQQNIQVGQNQQIVVMENEDLDSEYKILESQRLLHFQKHSNARLMLTHSNEKADLIKIQAQIDEAADQNNLVVDRKKILQKKRQKLEIRSPIEGMVVDWNNRQRLMNRPVNMGERLMTVVDPKGAWEVEAYLPERGSVHVLKEFNKGEEVKAEFVLSSHPGKTFSGQVVDMEQTTHLHPTYGNVIRCTISFDKDEMDPSLRRPGTRVKAKIHCGTRSVGYVMFREVWETVQAQVLFWL